MTTSLYNEYAQGARGVGMYVSNWDYRQFSNKAGVIDLVKKVQKRDPENFFWKALLIQFEETDYANLGETKNTEEKLKVEAEKQEQKNNLHIKRFFCDKLWSLYEVNMCSTARTQAKTFQKLAQYMRIGSESFGWISTAQGDTFWSKVRKKLLANGHVTYKEVAEYDRSANKPAPKPTHTPITDVICHTLLKLLNDERVKQGLSKVQSSSTFSSRSEIEEMINEMAWSTTKRGGDFWAAVANAVVMDSKQIQMRDFADLNKALKPPTQPSDGMSEPTKKPIRVDVDCGSTHITLQPLEPIKINCDV